MSTSNAFPYSSDADPASGVRPSPGRGVRVRLKSLPLLAAALLPALALSACATTATVVRSGGATIQDVRLTPYDGPKARLAVASFEDRTAKGFGEIGDGVSTMFITALVNSNRFIVLERDQIDEVLTEQDLGASGRVREETAAPVGEIEGAELLLTGAVTEFEPEKFGLGSGIVGGATFLGSLFLHEKDKNIPIGAVTYIESHIAIDVRLVDAATSRVLSSVTVESKGQDWGGGLIAEIGGGRTRLPLGFGGFQHTATEKAVRQAVDAAVGAIASQVPPTFYHYADTDLIGPKIVGYEPVDLPGALGAGCPTPGVRTASSEVEWSLIAADLGLEQAAPPVDLSQRQLYLVCAGRQEEPGRAISIEQVVHTGETIEVRAGLTEPLGAEKPAENGAKGGKKDGKAAAVTGGGESARYPVAAFHTLRFGLPATVVWAP